MKQIKSLVIGFLVLLALVLGAWAFLFGTSSPCDAANKLLSEALRDEQPNVRKAALDALGDMQGVQCFAVAARLRAGDRSFIKIVNVH